MEAKLRRTVHFPRRLSWPEVSPEPGAGPGWSLVTLGV